MNIEELRAVLPDPAYPLPWRVKGSITVVDSTGDIVIFDGDFMVPENKRYIVAACNAVPALLARLDAYAALEQAAQDVVAAVGDVDASSVYVLGEALAALQAAK